MSEKIETFEDLKIRQEGLNLVVEIYAELKSGKDYCLRDQILRPAVSIPSTIAEGFDRNSKVISHDTKNDTVPGRFFITMSPCDH